MKFELKGRIEPQTLEIVEFIPITPYLRGGIIVCKDKARYTAIYDAHQIMAVADREYPYFKVYCEDGKGALTKS